MDKSEVVGVILAGGRSRRMGGGDKGLRELGSKPMLSHVIERIRPQVAQVIINANGEPDRFSSFELPVVADGIKGFAGPLAGVLSGMQWARKNAKGARFIATVSADAPFLPADLIARLAAARAANPPDAISFAKSDDRLHPVIGLWPVHLASDLETALHHGVRKVLHWSDRHGTIATPFELMQHNGRTIDPFFNANTPEEFEEAREIHECLNENAKP